MIGLGIHAVFGRPNSRHSNDRREAEASAVSPPVLDAAATRTRSATQRFTIVLWFLLFWHPAYAFCANALDAVFLAGLRARGFYELAEKHALERWQSESTATDDRVELAIELARTYAEWAVSVSSAERGPLWAKAHGVTAEFAQLAPDHPRLVLVQVQGALTWLTAGEVARIEAEGAESGESYAKAKDRLRHAIRDIQNLAKEVETLLRQRRLGRKRSYQNGQNDLTVDQLDGLNRHIAIALAQALRNQALCYPVGSPDRVNALSRAVELLSAPGVGETDRAEDWRVALDRIACQRLLGHGDLTRQQMRAVLDRKPPPEVVLRVEAERVRLLLAEGDLQSALDAVELDTGQHDPAAPQLDFAHLEALLAVRRLDAEQRAAVAPGYTEQNLTASIAAQVRQIHQRHSRAWARRAELVVGRAFASAAQAAGGPNAHFDVLRMAAESLVRAGDLEAAVAAYDRAATAVSDNSYEKAIACRFSAAAMELKLHRPKAAQARLLDIASMESAHARAAEAHRLAILCAADLVRLAENIEGQRQAVADYAALLDDHVKKWPASPTADEARMWMGNLHQGAGQWGPALQAYRQVRSGSNYHDAAIENAAACFEQALAQATSPGESTASVHDVKSKLVAEATKFLQPEIIDPDNRWPEVWSPHQRAVALSLARIQLFVVKNPLANNQGSGQEYARRVLAASLGKTDGADAGWQAKARALLIEALVLQGKTDEAVAILPKIPITHRDVLIPIVKDIGEAIRGKQDDLAKRQGEFILRITSQLAEVRAERDDTAIADLDAAQAAAFAAVGRHNEALAMYDRLAKSRPKDANIQESRAALLGQSEDPAVLRSAVRAWQNVERGSRPGGPRWFRARYQRCAIMLRLNQRKEASKLIRLTTALHPELGSEAMRRAFKQLQSAAAGN